jgi:protein tyrosine/serine phosphatase
MKMRIFLLTIMALVLAGCISPRGFPAVDGIQNFDKVTFDHYYYPSGASAIIREKVSIINNVLYRGAQPDAEGIAHLKKLGVVKVINLRKPDDSWPVEKVVCEENGITYVNIPMDGLLAPSRATIMHILSEIRTSSGPVFVHCQYGCERTGTVVACCRIEFQSMSNKDALQEAVIYGMSSMAPNLKQFIRDFKP